MSGPEQIPMDLPLPASASGTDFLTSPSNQPAWDAIHRWQEWPDRRMIVTGPEGAGKSHLVQVWASLTGVATASAVDLTETRMVQLLEAEAVAVEDVDQIVTLPGPVKRQIETLLFHLFNLANAGPVSLLMTGRAAPAHWHIETPDLASRVQSMPHVRISEPDDALLAAILKKMFSDRQMQVGDDVIEYLIKRIERSFASAETIVARLDRAALVGRRGITRPLAAAVLSEREDHDR